MTLQVIPSCKGFQALFALYTLNCGRLAWRLLLGAFTLLVWFSRFFCRFLIVYVHQDVFLFWLVYFFDYCYDRLVTAVFCVLIGCLIRVATPPTLKQRWFDDVHCNRLWRRHLSDNNRRFGFEIFLNAFRWRRRFGCG